MGQTDPATQPKPKERLKPPISRRLRQEDCHKIQAIWAIAEKSRKMVSYWNCSIRGAAFRSGGVHRTWGAESELRSLYSEGTYPQVVMQVPSCVSPPDCGLRSGSHCKAEESEVLGGYKDWVPLSHRCWLSKVNTVRPFPS